jgi:hypothetical protein
VSYGFELGIEPSFRLNHAYGHWVLGQTGADNTRCAEVVGISLSTLHRWQRSGLKTS